MVAGGAVYSTPANTQSLSCPNTPKLLYSISPTQPARQASKLELAGLVAQRIERLRPKEGVGGSSPSEGANSKLWPHRKQLLQSHRSKPRPDAVAGGSTVLLVVMWRLHRTASEPKCVAATRQCRRSRRRLHQRWPPARFVRSVSCLCRHEAATSAGDRHLGYD